jgi:N utilization substance protein A
VSVLVDHGITATLVEKLNEAQIATVEQLGAMTPEQLEEIPGIGPEMVERIQEAVVAYYGQYEPQEEIAPAEAAVVEESGAAPAAPAPAVESTQTQSVTIDNQDAAPDASQPAPGSAPEKGEQA